MSPRKPATTNAKASLSELVAGGHNATRGVIAKTGAAEPVGCAKRRKGGINWEKWDQDCRRLGFRDIPPEEVEAMLAALEDSALSRRVLGLEDRWEVPDGSKSA